MALPSESFGTCGSAAGHATLHRGTNGGMMVLVKGVLGTCKQTLPDVTVRWCGIRRADVCNVSRLLPRLMNTCGLPSLCSAARMTVRRGG
jgi:hypothetical protein